MHVYDAYIIWPIETLPCQGIHLFLLHSCLVLGSLVIPDIGQIWNWVISVLSNYVDS